MQLRQPPPADHIDNLEAEALPLAEADVGIVATLVHSFSLMLVMIMTLQGTNEWIFFVNASLKTYTH